MSSVSAKRANKFYAFLTILIFGVASIALALISLVMIVYAVVQIVQSVLAAATVGRVLDSVSIIVIAIAVFEVAKYLFEEEILRGERELRSVREARQTLTKFLVIIIIAVSLEALVFVFKANRGYHQSPLSNRAFARRYPARYRLGAVPTLVFRNREGTTAHATERLRFALRPPFPRAGIATTTDACGWRGTGRPRNGSC